jgi:hypothetical protein
MDAEDSRRAWRDQLFDSSRVQVMGRWIDIGEHRRNLLPLQGVGGRNEGKRWDDDLAAQLERANRYFQRDSSVAHRDAVSHANQFSYVLLKL